MAHLLRSSRKKLEQIKRSRGEPDISELAREGGIKHVEMLTTEAKFTTGFTTLRGLIIPVDWDERGNISSIAVSTNFEEEYLVDENPLADELLAFARLRVKVQGSVREEEGKKIITVEKYEVLEE